MRLTGTIVTIALLPIVVAVLRHRYPVPPKPPSIEKVTASNRRSKLLLFNGLLSLLVLFVIHAGAHFAVLPPVQHVLNFADSERIRIAPDALYWHFSLFPIAVILADWISGLTIKATVSSHNIALLRHAESVAAGFDTARSRGVLWGLATVIGAILLSAVAISSIYADDTGVIIREPFSFGAVQYRYDEINIVMVNARVGSSAESNYEIECTDGRVIRFGRGAWNATPHCQQTLLHVITSNRTANLQEFER